MTCIAGYIDKEHKTVYMGGDTAAICGNRILSRKDVKVFQRGNDDVGYMLIGFTGSFRMGQLLRYKLIIPKQPEGMDTYEYMCTLFIDTVRVMLKENGFTTVTNNTEMIGAFLVAYNNRLFKVESDLQVAESALHYDACGNGEEYALACMRTRDYYDTRLVNGQEIVMTALKVAEDFCTSVRAPFIMLKLEG